MNYHEDNAVAEFFGKNARVMSRSINVLISHGYLKITQQDESCAIYSIRIPKAVVDNIVTSIPDDSNVDNHADESQKPADNCVLKLRQANENIYGFEQASVSPGFGRLVTVSRVFLGKLYPGVYLSRRESECVFMLMLGRNRKEISVRLQISIKTIDFYIQLIKAKLGCDSSREIVSRIQQTDFVKNVQSWCG